MNKFDIPENWAMKNISQISILLKDGTHGSHISVEEGIPLLSAKDILNNKIILDKNPRLINRKQYNSIHKNWKIKQGDILLTIVGTLGRIAIVKTEREFTLQRSVAIVRINHEVCNEYIAFYFASTYFQNELILRANASAQAGVYLGELSKIKIPISSCLKEQKKIAAILSSVDRVIETTQNAIAQLQIVKRGLMQQLLTKE